MQISFQVSFNMQLIIHTMHMFLYQLFIHILQHFFQFFTVKCNLDETLQNGRSIVHFYRILIEQLGQGASKSSLLREVATPLSSCDN
jgi:hypothetical protein